MNRCAVVAAILACAFVGPAVSAVPTDGLIGYWDAEGDGADQSGNGLHGTVVGNVTFVPGRTGQAFNIPWGGVDYIDLPEIVLDGPFSITAWWSITSPGRHAIVGWGTGAGTGHDYVQVRDTNRYKYKFGVRQVNGLIDDYTDGAFHHVALTRDEQDRVRLYHDGVLIEQLDNTTGEKFFHTVITDDMHISAIGRHDDTWNAMVGIVDEVTVHERALTDDEILTMFEQRPVFEAPTDPACDSTFDWVAGKELTFDLTASDPTNGDLLTLTPVDMPAGATLTGPPSANPITNNFSWTPGAAQAGVHTFKFIASDGEYTAECSFTVNVIFDADGDFDDDGLPDLWEVCGFTAANGEFVDLPAMGADPERKDIFVEVDYMKNELFNHRPNDEAIFGMEGGFEGIVGVFARAPVNNPDGSTGITLHVIIDDEIGFVAELGSETVAGSYDWSGGDPAATYFEDLKQAHFTPSLRQVAHYCVFAHKLNFDDKTVSGMSRGTDDTGFAASEFVVSLAGIGVGGVGSMAQQAGTFMHELGHDLGLRHGGGDSLNNKPNYLSVMSHAFQLSGLVHSGSTPLFDFSRWDLPDLDENSQLSETDGLGLSPAEKLLIAGYGTKWYCPAGQQEGEVGSQFCTHADATGSIDWNDNGSIDSGLLKVDINGDTLPSGFSAAPVLAGFSDWENLVYRGGAIGETGVSLPPPPPVTEPPPEVNEEVVAALGPPAPTNLSGHPSDPQNTLSWKKVAVGFTYNVYRAAGGEVEFLGNTPNTNWHDKTAEDGVEYAYSVATVDEFGTEGPAATVSVSSR
jgi:hypothetical protein